MSTRTVYVVVAHTDHEASDVIAAFESAGEAAVFVEKCEAYESKRLRDWPAVDDPKFDQIMDKHDRWQKRHPGGPSQCDCWFVVPTKLHKLKASFRAA